jgi:hypothetical protein
MHLKKLVLYIAIRKAMSRKLVSGALTRRAAASAREAEFVPEVNEPVATLRPMTAGGEVVEDTAMPD